MGEGGGPASTVVDARSTTVVAIGTVVVAGSAVVVGGTAAVDGTAVLAGVVVVVRATVVVAGTAVLVGATVVVGTAFVVGVVVAFVVGDSAEVEVGVVVAFVVGDSAEVEVGAAVSELPPHPETTNKTVTATACVLTFQVCHPSPVGGGARYEPSDVDTRRRLTGTRPVLKRGPRRRGRLRAHAGLSIPVRFRWGRRGGGREVSRGARRDPSGVLDGPNANPDRSADPSRN